VKDSWSEDWGEIDARDPPVDIEEYLADCRDGVEELGVFPADAAGR
jgi:hypothetical protein